MKKILVLIDHNVSVLDCKIIISELSLLNKHSWKIILLNYLHRKRLLEDNIPCGFLDEYFFEEEHYLDYSQAIDISNKWFINSAGSDTTIYHEISMGVILQGWAIPFFSEFLSNVRTAERIFKDENPDEIWLCFSKSGKDEVLFNSSMILMEILSALAKPRDIICKRKIIYREPNRITLMGNTNIFLQKYKSLLYSFVVSRILFFMKYHFMMRKNKKIINILLPSPQSLSYMGNTIIGRLLSDKKKNALVWRGETARQRINLIDIPPNVFSRIKWSGAEASEGIERQFNGFIATSEIEELKNFVDLLKQVCKQRIMPLIRSIIFDIEQIELCFKKMSIQLVFSHADTPVRERTVVGVANKYKIPSIVLQHGMVGQYRGFFPLIATKFAAWGKIDERWFERNGVGKERICITGAANFDSYVQQINNNKSTGRMDWHGMNGYILYVTVRGNTFSTGFKHTEQDNELLLNTILDAVEERNDKLLVIKLRPGDPQMGFYKSEIRRRGLKNVYLIDVADNRKLLNACGVLLTTYSTMAIEALFFEKPVIQLKFINKEKLMRNLYEQNILCDEDIMPLAKYGAALGVEKPERLREAIMNIYENENIRQSVIDKGKMFLRECYYEPDGKASLRVLKCIDQLIQQEIS